MIAYVLTVFFACSADCGGAPDQFTTTQQYQTYSQCDAAGLVWLSPNGNPTQTIASYQCDTVASSGTPSTPPPTPVSQPSVTPPPAPSSVPPPAPVALSPGKGFTPQPSVSPPSTPPSLPPSSPAPSVPSSPYSLATKNVLFSDQ